MVGSLFRLIERAGFTDFAIDGSESESLGKQMIFFPPWYHVSLWPSRMVC